MAKVCLAHNLIIVIKENQPVSNRRSLKFKTFCKFNTRYLYPKYLVLLWLLLRMLQKFKVKVSTSSRVA